MWMSANEAVGTTEKDSSRTWHFNKTKMCKFHIIGACSKGPLCPFAHSKVEMRALPDLTCTKLCKALIETGVCNNKDCTYAHNKVELRTTSTYHKTKLCRFSLMGHCALGSKCNFAHTADELRPSDETTNEGEDPSMPSKLSGDRATGYPAVSHSQYLSPPIFWPGMNSITATQLQEPAELVDVEDSGNEMVSPPGLELYNSLSPLRSTSPVRISLNSHDADGPLYVTQTSFAPKIGEGLLRTVRSAGERLSDLGSDEPAFVKPLRTIRSAGGRLADFGDSRHSQKDSFVSVGHYFEGDNSSTPSYLSPRGSVHSTDLGDDHFQAEMPLLALDMQRKMADSLLEALRVPAASK
jgi:hypothetical protein